MAFANALESVGYTKPNNAAVNNIANINTQPKKKPYDIKINNNARQPKVTPNVKFSNKQRFRQYKTKREPELLKSIQVNDDEDIIEKIKAAFDPNYKKPNTNYTEQITAPAAVNNGVDTLPEVGTNPYPTENRVLKEETNDEHHYNLLRDIDDIDPKDVEGLTFQPAKKIQFMNDEEENAEDERFLNSIASKDPSQTIPEWEVFNDDDNEVVFAPREVKRLSMADTPIKKYKSPILNRREYKKISSPLRDLENRGRPEGSLGVVNRIKEDAFRTDDERIQHFKERKQKNQSKTPLSYKDLRNRDNKERLTIDNFFDY